MLGASGAIYGIMVAFAFFYPNEEMIFMFIPYPIKAKYLVPVIVGIDVVFGFSNIEGNPVAHFAHIGGALAGFVTVYIWNRHDRNKHWINY
jgi:membrane associated rhomboid family serine protease